MSVTSTTGEKIVLERGGPNLFWEIVQREYAGMNPLRWRNLAILVLREEGCWPIERIGRAFGVSTGQVCRNLQETCAELSQFLDPNPAWDHFADEPEFEELHQEEEE